MTREGTVYSADIGHPFTCDNLLLLGYNEFPVNHYMNPHVYRNFEKWIYRNNSRAYAIHVYVHDYRDFPNCPLAFGFTPSVQLNSIQDDRERTFNLEAFAGTENDSIESVEDFLEQVFTRLNCRNYDR